MEIEKLSAEELKQKLEGVTITIEKKAGENERRDEYNGKWPWLV